MANQAPSGFHPTLLPPVHIARSLDNRALPAAGNVLVTQNLPLHQQSEHGTTGVVPSSYANPTNESTFCSPPSWSQGK